MGDKKTRWIVSLTIEEFLPRYSLFGNLYKYEWNKVDYEPNIVFYTKFQLHNFLVKAQKKDMEATEPKNLKHKDVRYIIHKISEVQMTKEFEQADIDKFIGGNWEDD